LGAIFAQIFSDFYQIFSDFAGFLTNQNFLGYTCTPASDTTALQTVYHHCSENSYREGRVAVMCVGASIFHLVPRKNGLAEPGERCYLSKESSLQGLDSEQSHLLLINLIHGTLLKRTRPQLSG